MGMTTNTNSNSLDALGYAKAACETMMRKFQAADLPPKGHFHYHQGVFLSGMMETWKESGDDRYFEKAKFINSDSTLYKQAGNGVVVNVVREIAKKMELKKESTNGANY